MDPSRPNFFSYEVGGREGGRQEVEVVNGPERVYASRICATVTISLLI